MTTTSAHSQTLLLPDGRHLGYAIYGTLSSPKYHVLYFHGLQSSRLEAAELDVPASELEIQLISIDRPGIGLSSPQPHRRITDWPSDVSHLVEYLQLTSFSILAVSGGAPYALACARALDPAQLLGVSIVAGVAPAWELGTYGLRSNLRISTFLAQWLPLSTLGNLLDKQYGLAARDSDLSVLEQKINDSFAGLDESSAELFKRPGAAERLVDNIREAYKQGSSGAAQEMKLIACHWGFILKDVKDAEGIRMYIGTEDCNMPLEMARKVQKGLSGSTLQEYEGDSHFSVIPKHGRQILRDLIGDA